MTLKRIILFLTVFVIIPGTAAAEFRMSFGLGLHQEYDDNIYLESDNEEDDFITTLTPNFGATWDAPRLDLSLNASVTMEKYLNNKENDRFGAGESNQSSSLTALARIYRELLFLRVSDTYQRVPVDEGGPGGENNRTINLSDSNRLQINPYLQLQPLKATSLQLGYTYENVWYKENEGDDADTHTYSANLTQELSPRVSASLSGSYSEYRPKDPVTSLVATDGAAYEYNQKNVNAGLTYRPTERLTLNGSYGRSWLDYDLRSDSESNHWSGSVDYELSRVYTAGVKYARSYVVSVDNGPSETDRLTAHLAYTDRGSLKLSAFTNESTYVEIDRQDDSYGGELSGEFPFNDRMGVNGLVRYTKFKRTGLDTNDYDRYSTRLALYFDTRLGRFSIGHIYNRNNSALSTDEYTSNIAYLDISLKF